MKTIPPRILKEAKNQADRIAGSIANRYAVRSISKWEDITKQFSIEVPIEFTQKPWTYDNVANIKNPASFAFFWAHTYEIRLQASYLDNSKSEEVKVCHDVESYGEFTLKPDQQGVLNYVYDFFVNQREKAVFDMSYAGAGKGTTSCCLLAKLYATGFFNHPDYSMRMVDVMIFCPRNVAEHWRRELEKAGLRSQLSTRRIFVFPHSDFNGDSSSIYCEEEINYTTGESLLKWNILFQPSIVILDEEHHFCNRLTRRTQAIEALAATPLPKHFLCLSATAARKINDLYLFTQLAQPVFQGVKITTPNQFGYMARCLDSRPDKMNEESLKRYRKAMSKYIVSVPYVKPKYSARTTVKLFEFESSHDKEIYDTAVARCVEACAKAGKNTSWGRWQRAQEIAIMNRTVEPLRAPGIAREVAANFHSGKFASCVGTAYLETICEIGYRLVTEHGVPREKISVIWGGKKAFQPTDLLTQDELKTVLGNDTEKLKALAESDKRLSKKIIATLNYVQDQIYHGETPEEQAKRHKSLKQLGLTGIQSLNNRQIEIDKFQSGKTLVNLFTVYCGKEGLSFDRYTESLLPRIGYFTPIYDPKAFQQVLNRLVRRRSIDNADQYVCMMSNSSEHWHVAPILDKGLKCISAITGRFMENVVDLLAKGDSHDSIEKLRDATEAAKDAENDSIVDIDVENEDDEDSILEEIIN